MHLISSFYPLSVLLCIGLVNAQARLTSTASIIGIAVSVTIAASILLTLMIILILIKYWTVLRKRAAQNNERAMMLRAQQGMQEPSTTLSFTLQQPHHRSQPVHTWEDSVLPTPPESELQCAPPPTYSASSKYPVYIEKGSQSQGTSHGDLPPPYIP